MIEPWVVEVSRPGEEVYVTMQLVPAPQEAACWIPDHVIRMLRMMPDELVEWPDGRLVPAYTVNLAIWLDPRGEEVQEVTEVRVYRDSRAYEFGVLGARLVSLQAVIPPISASA